jgi:hypothetical protein
MFFRNSLWPGASMIVNERRYRAEGHPGRVHRDVLRLLLEQRVHEEGILKLHPLGLAGGLDALGLAVGNRVGVEEEPADQGRLSVVDVAHHDELEVVGRSGPAPGGGRGRRASGKWREGGV